MQITERRAGEVTILDLSGPVTRNDGQGEVRAAVAPLLQSTEPSILLNMAGVDYMDSTGIGELVSVFISVRNRRGTLKITNLTDRMRELFAVAQLVKVFELFDDEATAVRSF